eukprot:snap_masked-scaffold_12-processed-gene-2.19-mRNA-1 protein AED:1.00 eAED:1.00 QI:0/-1/0/0/-1/1/1/0/87
MKNNIKWTRWEGHVETSKKDTSMRKAWFLTIHIIDFGRKLQPGKQTSGFYALDQRIFYPRGIGNFDPGNINNFPNNLSFTNYLSRYG